MLSRIPRPESDAILVGSETSDDAGVVRVTDDMAVVATLDFITPLVDDPAAFGAIAAANAVSDVYAMGATPLLALSIACFPASDWPLQVLGDILAGGAATLLAAGAPVIGGHTIDDPEMKIGYAVIGRCRPDDIWRNSTARPGDELVLTKALGTGVLAAAAREGDCPEPAWAAAVAQMRELNGPAASAVVREDVHAATDITGFGLLGHAAEMARGAGVTLRLRWRDIPLLEGALAQSQAGRRTRSSAANLDYARPVVVAPDVPPALLAVLHDPQTSGGLLLALAPGGDSVRRLRAAGCRADVIGVVEERQEAPLIVA